MIPLASVLTSINVKPLELLKLVTVEVVAIVRTSMMSVDAGASLNVNEVPLMVYE